METKINMAENIVVDFIEKDTPPNLLCLEMLL